MEGWRVAQLLVDRGPGKPKGRGSGYLVAPGRVLTAAHVLADAVTVTVLLDVGKPGEIRAVAKRGSWWADRDPVSGCDLAVVTLPSAPSRVTHCPEAIFGRIGEEANTVIQVRAAGFPRHNLRFVASPGGDKDTHELVRDLEQVEATAPLLANRRQGTLAVCVTGPLPSAGGYEGDRTPSPWEGFSGAAVWACGRIVAVVTEHDGAGGAGRLSARRIDRAYDRLPERVRDGLGLPARVADLADVISPSVVSVIRSVYQAEARDIAPDKLEGREDDLDDWTEFCAGPEAYVWWQAEAWTGKSALASWFVANPPEGLDIISFFVTRLAGRADSEAFFRAVVEQLRAYPGLDSYSVEHASRSALLSVLLDRAAQLAGERGRRLVLVVDGLDEDEAGTRPGLKQSSIASLLPRRPAANLRIILTSRPEPGIPEDVRSPHPLLTCQRVTLSRTWISDDLERWAKQELRDVLDAAGEDPLPKDIVGYIAASGGGLTRDDLETLTGTLSPIASTAPCSSSGAACGASPSAIRSRAPTTLRRPACTCSPTRRYQKPAEEKLRTSLDQATGPASTPGSMDFAARAGLTPPPRTPSATTRACWPPSPTPTAWPGSPPIPGGTSGCAMPPPGTWTHWGTSSGRRTRFWSRTQVSPASLTTLAGLAACRDDLIRRNENIPATLPGLWIRLGDRQRAEGLLGVIESVAPVRSESGHGPGRGVRAPA